ncbi:D-alanyl-D-alanine carboxypeptidase family protein [Lawsonibacter sp. LCP25S3_G6]|uniref:D-alanyl-D-alanine carboxypeptidase family protein n=1 Tax=unclassified Lawsonibacter TaxID=2617946 RepID=UPI003F9DB28E
MKKYFSRLFSLLLTCPILLSLFALPAAAEETDLNLFCTHAILMDANYNEILYEDSAYEKAYPASLTKVLTALLVIEAIEEGTISADTMVTAGDTTNQGMVAGASTANIKVGETLSVEELLYCLLLPSANEAANILAVAVDGSIETFVEHMNRRASELGCKGTHFTNPNGLHEDDHYTTAYDLALMMSKALEYDLFRTIIGSVSHTVPATNLSEERVIYNTNGLISNWYYSGYVYDKCIGGKTGTTDQAGRCLVAAAEDGETLLVSVILGSGPMEQEGYDKPRQGQLVESSRLLKWGFSNFRRVTITQSDEPVAKVAVTLSREADEVNLKPQGSITRTLPKDMDLDQIETRITIPYESVEAPVEEGQVLGTMTLSYEGEVYGTLDLVAVTSVERSDLLYKKQQFIDFFQHTWVRLILVVIAVLVVLVLLRLFVFRKRRRYTAGVGGRRRGNYRGGRR